MTVRLSVFPVTIAGRKAMVRVLENKSGASISSGLWTFELSEDDLVELTRAAAEVVRQRRFWREHPQGVQPSAGAT